MRAPGVITYDSREALAGGLADLLAGRLRELVAAKSRAALAVPGGTTPGRC